MGRRETSTGATVWFDGDDPPKFWRCPHDRALLDLENVAKHVERFHHDCMSCNAEVLLCRAMIDIANIKPAEWHGRLGGVPPVQRGA